MLAVADIQIENSALHDSFYNFEEGGGEGGLAQSLLVGANAILCSRQILWDTPSS